MKVSVIITSYNYENFIRDAIESVLAQTYQDFELIIVDDASADSSVNIIENFEQKDSRIKVIKNTVNKGLSKSLKTGIGVACGEYIAILESDDKWDKKYLEKKLEIFSKYDVGLVYNDVKLIGYYSRKSEKNFNRIMNFSYKNEYPKNMFYDFGYENRILTLSSVMFKRDLCKILDFDTPIDKLLDWFLYVQLAKQTKFYYLPGKLTIWRQHKDSYINSKNSKKFKLPAVSAYLKFLKGEPFNLKLFLYIIFSLLIIFYRKLKIKIS